jgi:hypothetical protein
MKAMSGLNRKDFVIAYSSLDMVFTSITMTMSDKDVLAARTLVTTSMGLKVFAVIVQGISISNLSRFNQQCLTGLTHPVLASPRGFVWALWTTRNFAVCGLIPTILRVSPELNLYEHDSREYPRGLRAKTWHYLSTTLFTHYLLYFSIVFLQGVPVIILASSDISKSWGALWSEWGQSAALIVTGVACTHAGYTFFRLRKRVPLGYTPIESAEYCSPDELLTNQSLIGPDAQSLHQLNLEKQNTLWKEWILSVDLGDRRGMLECLQQGLPRDRSFAEEYPIHMAARFNDIDIIDGAYSDHEDDDKERCYERLCDPNQLGQTPILIAYKGGNFAAMETLLRIHLRYLDGLDLSSNRTAIKLHGTTYSQSVLTDLCEILKDAIKKEDVQILDLLIGKETVREWETIPVAKSGHCACLYALKKNKIQAARYLLTKSKESLFAHTSGHASYIREEDPLPLYKTIMRHFANFWGNDSGIASPIRASVDLDTICKVVIQLDAVELTEILAFSTLELPQYFLDYTLMNHGKRSRDAGLQKQLMLKGGIDSKSIGEAISNVEIHNFRSKLEVAATDGNLPRILHSILEVDGSFCQPLTLLLCQWSLRTSRVSQVPHVSRRDFLTTIKLMLQGGTLNAPVTSKRVTEENTTVQFGNLRPLTYALLYCSDPIFYMMLQYAGSANKLTGTGQHRLTQALWAVCDAPIQIYHNIGARTRRSFVGTFKVNARCAQSIDYLLQQGAVIDLDRPRGKESMDLLVHVVLSEYDNWTQDQNFVWILETLKLGRPKERSLSGHEHGDECHCDWPLFRPGMAASSENNASAPSVKQKEINKDFLVEELHIDDEPEWCMSGFEKHGHYGEFWKTWKKDDEIDNDESDNDRSDDDGNDGDRSIHDGSDGRMTMTERQRR